MAILSSSKFVHFNHNLHCCNRRRHDVTGSLDPSALWHSDNLPERFFERTHFDKNQQVTTKA